MPYDEQLKQHSFMLIPTEVESDALIEAECYSFQCLTAGVKIQWMDDLKRYLTLDCNIGYEKEKERDKENIGEFRRKRSSKSKSNKHRDIDSPLVRQTSQMRISSADRSHFKKISKQFGYFGPNTPENNGTTSLTSSVSHTYDTEKNTNDTNTPVLPSSKSGKSGVKGGSSRIKKNSESTRVLSFLLSKDVQTQSSPVRRPSTGSEKVTDKSSTGTSTGTSNGTNTGTNPSLPELPRKLKSTKSQPRRTKLASIKIPDNHADDQILADQISPSSKKHFRSKTHLDITLTETQIPPPPSDVPPLLPTPRGTEAIPISLPSPRVTETLPPLPAKPVSKPPHPTEPCPYVPGEACHRCNIEIPKDVSKMMFQNRTYHCKCYYCSTCKISLMDSRAFNHLNDLYCSDCIHNVSK